MKTMLNRFRVNKKYISETDRFLAHFDQKNPNKSLSQQKEIEDYQRLFYKRDIKTNRSEP